MGIWFEKILSLIYPRLSVCVSCLKNIDNNAICIDCLADITLNENFDKKCFEHFEADYASYYSGSIKNIIYNFKVHKNFYCGEYLSEILISYINKRDLKFDYITYVPRDTEKIKKEGFDQNYFLGKILSKKLGVQLIKLLYCKGKKLDQKNMNINDRYSNVKNKFFVNKYIHNLSDKKVLLIDDVATTYSTLNEVVNVMKKSNPKTIVSVLTIAKTLI